MTKHTIINPNLIGYKPKAKQILKRTFFWAAGLSFLVPITSSTHAQIVNTLNPLDNISLNASGTEKTELENLIQETRTVLESNKFADNLKLLAGSQDRIILKTDGIDSQNNPKLVFVSAKKLQDILSGKNSKYHFHPTTLTLTGTYYKSGSSYYGDCVNNSGVKKRCERKLFQQNSTNFKAVTHGLNTYENSALETASIEIGREIHNRFRSKNSITKSCSMNTLAHEWSHTIGESNDHRSVMEDTVNDTRVTNDKNLPLASYLIGTTAQCTWLQINGHIPSDTKALNYCASRFGKTKFQSHVCDYDYEQ